MWKLAIHHGSDDSNCKCQFRKKKKNLPYPRHLKPQHLSYTVTVIEMVVMAVMLVVVEVVKVNIEAK